MVTVDVPKEIMEPLAEANAERNSSSDQLSDSKMQRRLAMTYLPMANEMDNFSVGAWLRWYLCLQGECHNLNSALHTHQSLLLQMHQVVFAIASSVCKR